MEKKAYKRTILEVFGDLISRPGKRFLVCIGLSVLCYLLGQLMGFFAVGFILLIYIAISIFDDTKTFYFKSLPVKLTTGETVPCILVKQKCYAYSVPPLHFFCPFFYVPYRVRYYLIKNVEPSEMEEGKQIAEDFISKRLVDLEELPKRYAKAVLENPQILCEELSEKVPEYRRQFCEDIKPFTEEGILQEEFFNSRFSVCKLYNGDYMLLHYERSTGVQRGFGIKESFVGKVREKPELLWDVLATEEISPGALTTRVLERLLLEKNGTTAVVSSTVQKINQNKQELTREIIMNAIKPGTGWKMFGAFWLFYFAVGGLCAVIGGIATGMFPVAVFGLAVLVLCVYYGVRVVKNAREEKKKYLRGNFRVVAAQCVSAEEETAENGSGWVHKFSNGVIYKKHSRLAVTGDLCYLVYRDGDEIPRAYYNSLIYKPAADLNIENL